MTFARFFALLLIALTANAADTIQVFGRTWTVRNVADWNLSGPAAAAQVLTLAHSRGPLPGPRRPIQFALTEIAPYRTLVLDAEVQPLEKSLMIVFAYRDEQHFDYAHLSVDAATKESHHNGIFHVYEGERVRISSTRGPSAFAASKAWYRVRLTHDALTGAVDVSVNGKPVPALHAVDVSLGAGEIGLGSFDETAMFRGVRIATR